MTPTNSDRRGFLMASLATAALVPAGLPKLGRRTGAQERPTTGQFLAAISEGLPLETLERYLAADPGLLYSRTAEGLSAFGVALLAGRSEVADMLAEHGYEPDLAEAAFAQRWERFDALAERAPAQVNLDHPLGGTAMFAAARGGAGADMWRVYRYGGDPNAKPRGAQGASPVRAAMEYSDLATAEITLATILSNGGNPNLPEPDGVSALHLAATRGSTVAVTCLLRKGADTGARDAEGHTPLDNARRHGHAEAERILANSDSVPRDTASTRDAIDVDGNPYVAPDVSGYSPAIRERMVGQSHRNLDEVRAIAERHPDLVHSVATTTERAVEACAHTGQTEIVRFLLDRGAPYSLPTAAVLGDIVAIREFLEQDPARVNERGAHDFALLWYPVIGGGNLDVAAELLEQGVQVEQHEFLGTTALHFAASAGQAEMVELLIEHGADVERVGRKFSAAGHTPLQLALAREHTAVADLLRSHGASR